MDWRSCHSRDLSVNTHAASFPTIPCRADLFTGKYGFSYLGWNPLVDEKNVLAEILDKEGYTTLASVDTPFLMPQGFGYDVVFVILYLFQVRM